MSLAYLIERTGGRGGEAQARSKGGDGDRSEERIHGGHGGHGHASAKVCPDLIRMFVADGVVVAICGGC